MHGNTRVNDRDADAATGTPGDAAEAKETRRALPDRGRASDAVADRHVGDDRKVAGDIRELTVALQGLELVVVDLQRSDGAWKVADGVEFVGERSGQ